VTELPDLAAIATMVTDRRFLAAVGIVALSGTVRGFSGFGSALIYIPLMSAVYEPRIATATILLIDLVCGFPFAVQAVPRCTWREVVPVTVAAGLAIPLGTMALVVLDPLILRWIIAAIVLVLLAVLASGWRYRHRPTLPVSIGVGLVSGLGSGAVQIAGPPVIIFWLGGSAQAAVVRANLMVFFVLIGAIGFFVYLGQGLLTAEVIGLSLMLGPLYLIAMAAGARWFHGTSDAGYRRIAYLIIAAAAIVSVPVFDRLLR
jgi:uncharacterized membrane protein YfcA